jgi:hypothetical protein
MRDDFLSTNVLPRKVVAACKYMLKNICVGFMLHENIVKQGQSELGLTEVYPPLAPLHKLVSI